jgi:hypothetical protein
MARLTGETKQQNAFRYKTDYKIIAYSFGKSNASFGIFRPKTSYS